MQLIGMVALSGLVAYAWSGPTATETTAAAEAPTESSLSRHANCTGRKELESSNDFLDPTSGTAVWMRQENAAERNKFGCGRYLDSLFGKYEDAPTGVEGDALRSEALLQTNILLDAGDVPEDNSGQVNWLWAVARLLGAANRQRQDDEGARSAGQAAYDTFAHKMFPRLASEDSGDSRPLLLAAIRRLNRWP